jgi:organic radical activating enzyme
MSTVFPIKIVNADGPECLQIRFLMTDVCNYKCSYCFPGSNEGNYRFPKNNDTVIKNFQLLLNEYKSKLGKTKFSIHLSGGEPTLWPGISKFCKELKNSHNAEITLITNGSRTLDWWDENSKYFNDVMISCHHEFSDVSYLMKVADLLTSRDVKVGVSVLMDSRHWNKCVSIVEQMRASEFTWPIQTKEIVSIPGIGMDAYSVGQLEYLDGSMKRFPDSKYFQKHLQSIKHFESIVTFSDGTTQQANSNTYINKKWNGFKGWSCDVASETLLITWDGSITGGCQESLFNRPFNIYSELFVEEFKLEANFKSIICPRQDCSCVPETHISKRLILS